MSRRWIAACLVLLLTPLALERLRLTSSSETAAQAAAQLTSAKPDDSRFNAVEVIAPGELDEPMTFAIADDGRVFINERRTGDIKMYDPSTGLTVRVGTIPVNHQYTSASGAPREAEEGFVGLTIDPDFEENGWAYILYADPDVAKHTLARIEIRDQAVDGVTQPRIVADSFVALLEYPVQREVCCHTGGGMTWDADGNLYVTIGNNTSNSSGSQTDERPGRAPWDDQRGAANTNDLRGKIIRIHPEADGTYTIPEGNLFPPGTPGTRPEIYTMGHRNPWRVSVDSQTGWIYWGEVGPDNNQDVANVGPRGYDEFNQAREPGFFGWPYFVGNNSPFPFTDYVNGMVLPAKDVNAPANTSVNNTGITALPPAQPALIYYPSAVSDEFPALGAGGRCAVGGPVYRRADLAPDATRPWPAYFEGKWIITECSRGWIVAVAMDDNGDYQAMERLFSDVPFAEPMDMKFGPDGSLYVLDYGSTWFAKSDDSRLVRIDYVDGNRRPVAVASSDRVGGVAPVSVALSADGTVDHDGDALQYTWQVAPLDGGAPRTFDEAAPTVPFDTNGTYRATLTVTDAAGASATASVDLVIGNEPPVVSVNVSGANQTFYTPGAPIQYAVEVTDAEDGTVAADRVALGIDYVPEGFDRDDVELGRAQVDATTKFGAAQALMTANNCVTCHNPAVRLRGPSLVELSERYDPDETTMATLIAKVRSGGSGVWGEEVMPANPQVTPNEVRTILQFMLDSGDTELASAPLEGRYTIPVSDVDSGRGSVLINAAYTDGGAAGAPWQTSQSVVLLRSPTLDLARADVMSGVDLPGGRGDSLGIIAKDGGYVAFRQIDLTGIASIDVAVEGGGRAAANDMGGTIEVRLGSPDGDLLGQAMYTPPVGGAGDDEAAPTEVATVQVVPTAPVPIPAGRGGGSVVDTAASIGFPPLGGPAYEAATAAIGRGGNTDAPVSFENAVAAAAAGAAGGRGLPPPGGRGGGGRGGGGGNDDEAPPALSIALPPTAGLRDVYIVFENDAAEPADRLMAVGTVTFVR